MACVLRAVRPALFLQRATPPFAVARIRQAIPAPMFTPAWHGNASGDRRSSSTDRAPVYHRLFQSCEDYPFAVLNAVKTVFLDPSDPKECSSIYRELADIETKKDRSHALDLFATSVRYDPSNEDAWVSFIHHLDMVRGPREALNHLYVALQHHPSSCELWKKMIRLSASLQSLDAARWAVRMIGEENINLKADALLNLAQLEFCLGRFEEAERLCLQAIPAKGKEARAFGLLIDLNKYLGLYERVRYYIEEGLLLQPRCLSLWTEKIFHCAHVYKDLTEVKKLAREACEVVSEKWRIDCLEARLCFRFGDEKGYQEAIKRARERSTCNRSLIAELESIAVETGDFSDLLDVSRASLDSMSGKLKPVTEARILLYRELRGEDVSLLEKEHLALVEKYADHPYPKICHVKFLIRSRLIEKAQERVSHYLRDVQSIPLEILRVQLHLNFENEVRAMQYLHEALQRTPREGRLLLEKARLHLNPCSRFYNPARAKLCLDYAGIFTNQSADIQLEKIRCARLLHEDASVVARQLYCKEYDLGEMWQAFVWRHDHRNLSANYLEEAIHANIERHAALYKTPFMQGSFVYRGLRSALDIGYHDVFNTMSTLDPCQFRSFCMRV
jgi:tetratricopeptide (TPR) repeat protein